MYLAVISNPLAEQSQTFDEFQNSLKPKSAAPVAPAKKPEIGMTKQQVQIQLAKSQKLLNSFIPPERK